MLRPVGEADQPQGLGYPVVDLGPRQAEILRPEGGIASHALGDHRVEGLLADQAHVTAARRSRQASHRHFA